MTESGSRWEKYDKKWQDGPPRRELVKALELVTARDLALDLGAGPLNDAKFLVASGFNKVIAIDARRTSDEIVNNTDFSRIDYQIIPAQDFNYPVASCDLISAQYSLPFLAKADLIPVIDKIIAALKPGGIFTGQFFGPNDTWNDGSNQHNFVEPADVAGYFHDCELLINQERESDAPAVSGPKHWHVINIVAKKTG